MPPKSSQPSLSLVAYVQYVLLVFRSVPVGYIRTLAPSEIPEGSPVGRCPETCQSLWFAKQMDTTACICLSVVYSGMAIQDIAIGAAKINRAARSYSAE